MADVEVARLTAVDNTRAAFDSVRRSITTLQQSALSMRSAFAAIGAGVSVAGFVGFVKTSIDAADALNKMSQRVGVSVEELSKLGYAAKLSDISTEQLGDGLRKLSVNLQEAGRGGGEAQQAFKALGFSQKELTKLNADQALKRIADQFAGIQDGAGKTALAVQLFGRSGSDLIPLLNQGSTGLKQLGDEAQRAGLVISTDTARAAETFNDDLTRLTASASALGIQFANTILPSIVSFTGELRAASQAAGGFSQGLATMIAGEAGGNAGRRLVEVETRLKAVREELGKLRGTIGDSSFAKSIPGLSRVRDLEIEESDLAATRDRLKKLQAIRAEMAVASAAPEASRRAAPALPAAGRKRADRSEQDAIEAAREVGRQTAAAAKDRQEIAEAYNRIDLEAQAKRDAAALSDASKAAAELKNIIGQTRSGQLEEIAQQERVLGEALAQGKISAETFDEALTNLAARKTDILSVGEAFKTMGSEGDKVFKDLEFAVQGWGRRTSDVFAEAVVTGKADFADLAQSFIKELISMAVYAAFIKPIISGIFGAGGGMGSAGAGSFIGLAKGGVLEHGKVQAFATGGIVTRPTIFPMAKGMGLMGEAGPEAILPLARGGGGRLGVDASGVGAAGNANSTSIVINVDSRADRADVHDIAHQAVRRALAEQRSERSRGRY